MGCCQTAGPLDDKSLSLIDREDSPKLEKSHSGDLVKINARSFMHHSKGVLSNSYALNEKLGDGAYGVVYKVTHLESGERRAMKSIAKSKLPASEARQILNEIDILTQLVLSSQDHPNILKIIEVVEDENYYHIISELCTGGELFERIIKQKSFTENVAAEYMRQVLSAVSYCHDRGIVHRDLKPENLLLENDSPTALLKVIDFGTSVKHHPGTGLRSIMGTVPLTQPYYIAPEILLNTQYDEKCDVWSCGVILYVLLSGAPPFGGKSDYEILEKVKQGTFNFWSESYPGPQWRKVSKQAKEFISRMLVFQPKQRPSARDLISDPWLTQSSGQADPLDRTLLENMKNFHGSHKLKQAAFEYIANYLTTVQETEVLRKMFIAMDKNQDGLLSREELEQGYAETGLLEALDIDEIMRDCDADGNGFIDYSEFLTAGINWKQALNNQRLEAAFRAFDLDHSGFITADEIKSMLGGANSGVHDEVWDQILKEADQNGDGMVLCTQIDLQEFKDLLTRKSLGPKSLQRQVASNTQ